MSKITDNRAGVISRRFASLIASRNPIRQLATDWAEGHNTSSGGPGVSGGGAADPTLARILRSPEGHGLADQANDVADRIDAWIRYGNALTYAATKLLPLDHPVAEMLAKHRDIRQAGAGTCQRCKRSVPGIRENPLLNIEADRLKGGYCYGQSPHCYDTWTQQGRPNRATFNESLNQTSGENETAGPTPVTPNDVPSSGSGGALRPEAGAA